MTSPYFGIKSVNPLKCLLSTGVYNPVTKHNLYRDFTLCALTAHRSIDGVKSTTHKPYYVPERNFYKYKVEVAKRVTWQKPAKVQCVLPQKSGDLVPLEKLDLNELAPEYKDSEELKTANELVRRVFTLGFLGQEKRIEAKINAVTCLVKQHKHDETSEEVKIARSTARIRNLQIHYNHHPKDGGTKVILKELIDFRKKRLKILRQNDYKRFEWLLEKLSLIYKPEPLSENRIHTRRYAMKKLTTAYCENLVQKRLDDYKQELESQKPSFFRHKLHTMRNILAEEKHFDLKPSFSEEEIKALEEIVEKYDLEEREQKKKKKAEDDDDVF